MVAVRTSKIMIIYLMRDITTYMAHGVVPRRPVCCTHKEEEEPEPTVDEVNNRTSLVFSTLEQTELKWQVYTYQIVRFSIASSKGGGYLFLLNFYGINYILKGPLKNITGK